MLLGGVVGLGIEISLVLLQVQGLVLVQSAGGLEFIPDHRFVILGRVVLVALFLFKDLGATIFLLLKKQLLLLLFGLQPLSSLLLELLELFAHFAGGFNVVFEFFDSLRVLLVLLVDVYFLELGRASDPGVVPARAVRILFVFGVAIHY